MSEVQTTAATVLTQIKKPVTSADYRNNAEFAHAVVTKATEAYNVAVAAFNRAQELENVGAGTRITFNSGKGEKAEVLTGQVITRLDNGNYQVLVQFVGAPAKLVDVKPAEILHVTADTAISEVAPEPTPESDADLRTE